MRSGGAGSLDRLAETPGSIFPSPRPRAVNYESLTRLAAEHSQVVPP